MNKKVGQLGSIIIRFHHYEGGSDPLTHRNPSLCPSNHPDESRKSRISAMLQTCGILHILFLILKPEHEKIHYHLESLENVRYNNSAW